MNTSSRPVIVAAAALLAALPSFAAVVANPDLTTGSGAIDPAGARTLDVLATGSSSIASLTGHADFRGAIQDGWTGFAGAGTSTNNIFRFTDSTLPALSFDLSGTSLLGTAGANISNVSRVTSGNTGYVIAAGAGGIQQVILTINLGSYDTGTSIFTPGKAVDAVGFTLADIRAGRTVTTTFFNTSNTLLSTQSVVGANAGYPTEEGLSSPDAYFGYRGDGTLAGGVSKIVIQIDYTSAATTAMGLDDFGFTSVLAVPEPSAFALLTGVAGLGFAGLRRRRRIAATA